MNALKRSLDGNLCCSTYTKFNHQHGISPLKWGIETISMIPTILTGISIAYYAMPHTPYRGRKNFVTNFALKNFVLEKFGGVFF